MRMITDTMYYGNYKFDVELDTGSAAGANQLTIWVAEKLNIATVPLKQFGVAQLLTALVEPERARLHTKLEEEKLACQRSFELEIASPQRPYTVPGGKQGQKIPEKVTSPRIKSGGLQPDRVRFWVASLVVSSPGS